MLIYSHELFAIVVIRFQIILLFIKQRPVIKYLTLCFNLSTYVGAINRRKNRGIYLDSKSMHNFFEM